MTPVPEQLHVVLEPHKFLLAPEELRIEQAAPGGVENGNASSRLTMMIEGPDSRYGVTQL